LAAESRVGHWYARSWLALAAPLIGALAGAIMAFPLLDMIGMCPVGRTCWRGSFLLLCRSALSSAPPPASGGGFSTAASLFAASQNWTRHPLANCCNRAYMANQSRHRDALPGWRRKGPASKAVAMWGVQTISCWSNRSIHGRYRTHHRDYRTRVKALGFDLVRVRLFGKSEVGDEEHTLQIMAERPDTGQLMMDDCVTLSHRISDRIDALEEAGETLIHEAYRLEVSSPGIDRPLTRLKDYANWVGHEARITLLVPVDGNRKASRANWSRWRRGDHARRKKSGR
jgi:ribosome maturation factor RimP